MLPSTRKISKATNHISEMSDNQIIKVISEFECLLLGVEPHVARQYAEHIVTKDGFEAYDRAIPFYVWYYDNYLSNEPKQKKSLTESAKMQLISRVEEVYKSIDALSSMWLSDYTTDECCELLNDAVRPMFPFSNDGSLDELAINCKHWLDAVKEGLK